MYRIFIGENLLVLSNNVNKRNVIPYNEIKDFIRIVDDLFKQEHSKIEIVSERIDGLWSDFQSAYKIIEAAGGIVQNQKKEILFIYRLGKWDLPKGKHESGESIKETAIREVEEECGITNLTIKEPIVTTYHMYKAKRIILKKTYWYKMDYTGNEILTPQLEEGIEKVVWQDKRNLNDLLKNTYGNIKLLFQEYF